MALTSFADVQAFLVTLIAANNIDIGGAPHAAFWRHELRQLRQRQRSERAGSKHQPADSDPGRGATARTPTSSTRYPGRRVRCGIRTTRLASARCRLADLYISPPLRSRTSRTGSPPAARNPRRLRLHFDTALELRAAHCATWRKDSCCSAAMRASSSEDNIYLEKGKMAPSNAALVEKAAKIIEVLGDHVATPNDARQMLGLPPSPR